MVDAAEVTIFCLPDEMRYLQLLCANLKLGCHENSDLRPPKNLDRSGLSKTQNTKELRPLGCMENSDPQETRTL